MGTDGDVDNKDSSSVLEMDVISLGRLFALTLSVHAFSYFLGYFNLSLAWLAIGVFIFVWREKTRRDQLRTQLSLRAVSQNPKQTILARLQDLPSWVHFPDVERAEWLNMIVKQMWPHIGGYVQNFIRDKIEPSVRDSLQKSLKISSFAFDSIDLGDVPPRVGGVKVYSDRISRKEIIMDLDIYYAGDCVFQVSVKRLKAGLKHVQMRGTVRVIMKPLVSSIPFFGGLQIFFLNRPIVDFNLTNVADVFDIPGLADLLRKTVVDQISNLMVLPNTLPIKLMSEIPTALFEMPQPAGVLRIKVAEARDLMKKDFGLIGSGKSDPYAVITVGAKEFRTKVIENNVNPVWDYYCEVMIFCVEGQVCQLEVYDDDTAGNDDDFLGRLTVDVQSVVLQGSYDAWVALDEAKTGTVHLELTWFTLTQSSFDLFQVMKDSQRLKEDLSSAVLLVFVDCAKNLPNSGKIGVEPSPYVRLSIANQSEETRPRPNTNDPVWEKGFSFLVHNPDVQDLSVEVMDRKSDKMLAALSYPLRQLLKDPKMSMHGPLHMKSATADCEITLLMQLKVFHAAKPKTDEILEERDKRLSSASVAEVKTDSPATGSRESAGSPNGGSSRSTPTPVREGSLDSNNLATVSTEDTTIRRRIVGQDTDSKKAKVQLTLRYSAQRQKLIVVVHRAVNVPYLVSGEAPDPYVKLYLLTDQSRDSKRKTCSVKSSCKPIYDETFEYVMAQLDVESHVIEVSVCARSSSSLFGRSITLGQVRVNLSSMDLSKASTEWFELEELKLEEIT